MASTIDYKALGFMCGLEIHQRLATEHKLFCGCAANVEDTRKVGRITRRQRAVAGELGVIDLANEFESKKSRYFIYNLFKSTACLVDTDEEPPHAPNPEALQAALGIAYSLNACVPDELEVMRKGVVDGSDPSSFQRTMMIGYDGKMSVGGKNIPITSLFLEEESSGIVSNTGEYVEYNLDRLGIPLIEIDTDPVIETPQEAKSVAMAIGLLLRLTGKAQRGIGSIRQDVNVSIKSGARVEIKGFQELDIMDTIIEAEISRQLALLAIKKELHERGAVIHESVDLTHLFAHTKAKIIEGQLSAGGVVRGTKLTGFKGLVGREIGTDLRLGSEISDYAKSAGVKGIIHGDEEMGKYGITASELAQLSRALDLKEEDSFILVAEKKERADPAINLAIMRARMALEGVPSETRAVDSKRLSTRFLRPMPGKSRMFPETDELPVSVRSVLMHGKPEKIDVEKIKAQLHREIKNPQLADQMLWSRELGLYRMITSRTKAPHNVVASILLEKFKELSRSGVSAVTMPDDVILQVFSAYAKGKITKAGIGEVFGSVPNSPEDVDRIIVERGLARITGDGLKKLVAEFDVGDKGTTMREIMLKHKLNVDGEELGQLLK